MTINLKNLLNPNGIMLLETAISYDKSKHSILYCPTGKESPYEPTSVSFFNEKGIVDTLRSLNFDVDFIHHLNLNTKFSKNLLINTKNDCIGISHLIKK